MARQKGYRPYQTHRSTSRSSRIVILTLLIVTAGIVVLIRTRAKKPAAVETAPPTTPYEEVIGDASAGGQTLSEQTTEPEAAVAAPEPTPAPTHDAAPMETATEPADVAVQTAALNPAPVEAGVQTVSTVNDAAANAASTAAASAETVIDPEAQALIQKAIEDRKAGKVIAARDQLNEALKLRLTPAIRQEVKVQMAKLSEQWLFSRQVLEGDTLTGLYKVMPGDRLSRIGKNHQVPYECLMEINGIHDARALQADQTIKVVHGPFHALVNLSTFTLDLYLQTMYVKSYKIGIGKPEHETPTGTWRVDLGGKLIKPTWTDPDSGRVYKASDPDYPLGSRWIALEGIDGAARGRTGFALHGTKEPETIGTRSSRGCIRLFNGEVIELYNLLEEGKSLVKVIE